MGEDCICWHIDIPVWASLMHWYHTYWRWKIWTYFFWHITSPPPVWVINSQWMCLYVQRVVLGVTHQDWNLVCGFSVFINIKTCGSPIIICKYVWVVDVRIFIIFDPKDPSLSESTIAYQPCRFSSTITHQEWIIIPCRLSSKMGPESCFVIDIVIYLMEDQYNYTQKIQ